jgi:polyisoprenoid-binding protein YceI
MSITTTENTVSLPVGSWQLDPAHSRVEFSVDYMGGSFRGTFQPFEAQLEVAGDGTASLSGKARAESIQVNDEILNALLQTPDFFDAERTPELTFSANGVERSGDKLAIDGELTIRGNTQPIRLEGTLVEGVVDAYNRERLTFKLTGHVDRTAFGIAWNMPLPSGEPALANDVDLSAQLFLVKA